MPKHTAENSFLQVGKVALVPIFVQTSPSSLFLLFSRTEDEFNKDGSEARNHKGDANLREEVFSKESVVNLTGWGTQYPRPGFG